MEEWKDYSYGDCKYRVSNTGKIYSCKYNRLLTPKVKEKGYLQVHVGGRGGTYKQLHRIVAEVFIPNPNNLPQVNHIDEDKTNNNVSNLEWCDNKYNCNYGNKNIKMMKPIINLETGQCWCSISECAKWYGVRNNTIYWRINKGRYAYL